MALALLLLIDDAGCSYTAVMYCHTRLSLSVYLCLSLSRVVAEVCVYVAVIIYTSLRTRTKYFVLGIMCHGLLALHVSMYESSIYIIHDTAAVH